MRMAVIVYGSGNVVHGTLAGVDLARMHLSDRVANGDAWPSEQVVRLPRRLSRIRRYENYSAWIDRLRAWCMR